MFLLSSTDQSDVPSKHLWVGNLPAEADAIELRRVFAGEGRAVLQVILYKSRNYAYVLFRKPEEAAAAKTALQNAAIGGFSIKIEFDHDHNISSLRSSYGLKFMPGDRDLMVYFLDRKVQGQPIPIPFDSLVLDEDLYGDSEPWQIWEKHGGNFLEKEDLYFFTELKRKHKDGSRINRRVGSGTWKGEDGGKSLHFRTECGEKVVGIVKRFRYEDGVREMEGRWIMHEYSIQIDDPQSEMKDYVLCRIRKNEEKEKREIERMLKRKRASEYQYSSEDEMTSAEENKVKVRKQLGEEVGGHHLQMQAIEEVEDSQVQEQEERTPKLHKFL